ncbi:hypothetical protein NDN08_007328 [Rhodosorus marinus]|uniref:Palmitoyltransferase n=1 Tax=Rhodosorus marinus TaxID=101924 RepID=A0AAV8UJP3_9RHOD|nr:hypothetical protein NDN08_007328 [Rhodosorus marinus]
MGRVLAFVTPFLTKRPAYDVDKVHGNNKFFMRKKALLGPGYLWSLVPAAMILIPSLLFVLGPVLWMTRSDEYHTGGLVIIILPKFLILVVLASMWRAMSQDPGIVPRREMVKSEEREDNHYCPKIMHINEQPVEVKFCETCKVWKSPRVEHCRICDNCVEGYSHHSILLGTCVGKRTYGNFICFVVFTFLVSWMRFAMAVVYLHLYTTSEMESQGISRDEAFDWILSNSAAALAFPIMILCMAGGLYSGYLLLKHGYLMWTNQTAHELNRRTWKIAGHNPFSERGFKSIRSTLFVSKPPSKLHEGYCEDPEKGEDEEPVQKPMLVSKPVEGESTHGYIELL